VGSAAPARGQARYRPVVAVFAGWRGAPGWVGLWWVAHGRFWQDGEFRSCGSDQGSALDLQAFEKAWPKLCGRTGSFAPAGATRALPWTCKPLKRL